MRWKCRMMYDKKPTKDQSEAGEAGFGLCALCRGRGGTESCNISGWTPNKSSASTKDRTPSEPYVKGGKE